MIIPIVVAPILSQLGLFSIFSLSGIISEVGTSWNTKKEN
jgi:hypothetical protein